MNSDTLIADQQHEIAGLREQLRLEREAHEKTARERDRLAKCLLQAIEVQPVIHANHMTVT